MGNNKGFTLVELIVVIAIMGVILILALPQVSKIQSANKDRKYDAYYSSIESGAKLYIDSRSKDLFGNNTSGCVTVPYSELKKQNLVKDFGDRDITCSDDDETYVEVRKVNDNYLYSTAITCRNSEKIVYEKKIDTDLCTNEPDTKGPTVTLSPSSHDWVQSKNLKINIIISDDYTLNKNIGIIYYWTDTSGAKVSEEYTHNYKNKKGVKKVSYKIPTSNIPTVTGQYKLVVRPWYSSSTSGIQDALGNQTVIDTVSGIYKIDNDKPVCGESTNAKKTWTNTPFEITQACEDAASGCKKNPYSKYFDKSTKTYTFTIEDKAGNTNTCDVDVYLDVDDPTCGNVEGESEEWTGGPKTISVECKDTGGSNCVKSPFEATFTTEGKTDEIIISDVAGNTNSCTVNKYIDKTPPNCPSISSTKPQRTWTKDTITFTFGFTSDTVSWDWYTGSGGNYRFWYTKKTDVTKVDLTGSGKQKIKMVVYDEAGNSKECFTDHEYWIDKSAPGAPIVDLVDGNWKFLPNNSWRNVLFYTAGSTDRNNPVPTSIDTGSGISKYQISPDNKTWYDWNFWDRNSFSDKLYRNYSDGKTYRYVRAVDKVGNISPVTTKIILQDRTKPFVKSVSLGRLSVRQWYVDEYGKEHDYDAAYIKSKSCSGTKCEATICLVNKGGLFLPSGFQLTGDDVHSKFDRYEEIERKMLDKNGNPTQSGGCLWTDGDDPCSYDWTYRLYDNAGNTSTYTMHYIVGYIGQGGEPYC